MISEEQKNKIIEELRKAKGNCMIIKEIAQKISVNPSTASKYVANLLGAGKVTTKKFATATMVCLSESEERE